MASLLPAAEAIGDPGRVDVLIGAKTASEVLLLDRARKASNEVHVSTDDGSMGKKGTVVDMVQEHLEVKRYDMVLGCGPERMLSALLKACDKASVECQLSLERYMKCGAGLCGSCVIDGIRVCREGPVFSSAELRKMKEFGQQQEGRVRLLGQALKCSSGCMTSLTSSSKSASLTRPLISPSAFTLARIWATCSSLALTLRSSRRFLM